MSTATERALLDDLANAVLELIAHVKLQDECALRSLTETHRKVEEEWRAVPPDGRTLETIRAALLRVGPRNGPAA